MIRALVATLLAAATVAAHAQPYPQRPVRMIVPFASGGLTDGLARLVAVYLGEQLKQSVVVENRPGGGGTIGTEVAARATSDGYNILLGSLEGYGMTYADARRLNYNPEKDLAPIAMVARPPNLVIVHPSVKAGTMMELIELARANPGKIRYGSPGIGGNAHIIGERLKQRFGIDLVHVPYKGGGSGINDLISGQIEMMLTGVVTATGHVRAGKARGLAAGTPPLAIARLTQEVLAVKQNPEFRKRIADIGQQPSEDLVGAEFGRYMVAEAQRWREMAATAGLKD